MKSLLLSVLSLAALAGAADAQNLTLDPTGTRALRMGYMPVRVALSSSKPARVTKEPAYESVPKYGVIRVGNGPKSEIAIALDEPSDEAARIYVDANGDGDLTNDGDGRWAAKRLTGERKMYGTHPVSVRASWGDASMEYGSAPYGIAFYRFAGTDFLLMYREGLRTGTVVAGDKSYKATLIENDGDAVFNKKMDGEGKPIGKASNPVWLQLTPEGGKTVQVDPRAPFKLDGKTYEAGIPADGSRVNLRETTKAAYAPKVREAAPRKPLLASGTVAPNFTCYTLDGKPVQLSDLKGKVVIMDFWATWCGPCMVTMPHLEKTWQKIKDRTDVTVIGVCVWDEKDAYTKWVPENKSKFTFPLLFDPAGRGDKSIAGGLYNVSGIPTTYVIGKDGKVFSSLVGSGDIPAKLGGELKKLGIDAE